MPQELRYFPKIFVALIWSLTGYLFLCAIVARLIIPTLAIQPDRVATPSIALVSSPGFMILCGMLTGLISLILWHRSFNKVLSFLLGATIPFLLFFGAFAFAMADTQSVWMNVFQAAERGNLQDARGQLITLSPTVSQAKQLIQLGANVNVRDSQGRSALYSASWAGRDPEIIKLLLRSGAKPDSMALRNAISWGRLDAIQLMFQATSDDGRALIAELGEDALRANNVHTLTSEADRGKITLLLIARGAKPIVNE
jgi:uncharacterized protein